MAKPISEKLKAKLMENTGLQGGVGLDRKQPPTTSNRPAILVPFWLLIETCWFGCWCLKFSDYWLTSKWLAAMTAQFAGFKPGKLK